MNDIVDAGVADRRGSDNADCAMAAVSDVSAAAGTASMHFGARLAAKRRELGLSQGDIAERLRLHPRRIAALESADLGALPALTFVRGYVRNYARSIGLEAEPLLANLAERVELSRSEGSGRDRESEGDALIPPSAAGAASALSGPALRPVVIASVVGALVIFAIVGVVASRKPVAPAAAVVPATAVVPPAPTGAAATVKEASAGATAPDRAASHEPARVAPSEAPRPAAAAAKATDVPARGLPAMTLRLSFRESAWVEVAQGDGRVLHSQVNPPGTEQRFEGQPPYRLVIGNASTVTVEWRGRMVDLKPQTNFDNVARITLD